MLGVFVFLDLSYICQKQVLLGLVPYLSHEAPVFQPPGVLQKAINTLS